MPRKYMTLFGATLLLLLSFAVFTDGNKYGHAKKNLIDHLAKHPCEMLDHKSLSRQLGISQNALFDLLLELERENRIRVTMNMVRKPILLSHEDKANYFWIVCLVSEQ